MGPGRVHTVPGECSLKMPRPDSPERLLTPALPAPSSRSQGRERGQISGQRQQARIGADEMDWAWATVKVCGQPPLSTASPSQEGTLGAWSLTHEQKQTWMQSSAQTLELSGLDSLSWGWR